MPRAKRDPIEVLRVKIAMHFYCLVAGIEMTSTDLSLYVENSRDSYSKYDRFINGENTPSPDTFKELCEALDNHQVNQLNTENFKRLFNLSLWKALLLKGIDERDENEILFKMPFDIQKSIAHQDFEKMQLSLKRRLPCDKSVNFIERLSSFEALTALILIIRKQKIRTEKYDDAHIHMAIFRMLLSFFHHPSFQAYVDDIWSYIQNLLREDDEPTQARMGIGYWNYSAEYIKKLVQNEITIHSLAKKAKIIEDHTDIPCFNYFFYRSDDKKALIESMQSIANGKPTSMLGLDEFFHKYRQTRRKGKCSIDYPTLNFLELCIE